MKDGNHLFHGPSAGDHSPAGTLSAAVGEGRLRVTLRAVPQGRDWVLKITGGEAHVGAVATAFEGRVQLAVIGKHKEGPLAERAAARWAALTRQVCVAVAGIHQDRATRPEIDAILENVDRGLECLMEKWREQGEQS